jgi:hypothetical protein
MLPTSPLAVPQQEDASQPDVQGAWKSWMGDEKNRAALMQFGLALTQPMGWGQNNIGHIGSALGQAGEAAGRQEAAQLKMDSEGSKSTLREAQAGAAESRANVAVERSSLGADKLQLERERLDMQRGQGNQKYATALMKQFEDAKVFNPKLTLEEYMARNPQMIAILKQEAGMGGGGSGTRPSGKGSAALPPPKVGDKRGAYTYMGGDPNVETSWKRQ